MRPVAKFSLSQGEATPRDGSDRNQQERSDFFDMIPTDRFALAVSVEYDRPA
jgi:hypothetical protein